MSARTWWRTAVATAVTGALTITLAGPVQADARAGLLSRAEVLALAQSLADQARGTGTVPVAAAGAGVGTGAGAARSSAVAGAKSAGTLAAGTATSGTAVPSTAGQGGADGTGDAGAAAAATTDPVEGADTAGTGDPSALVLGGGSGLGSALRSVDGTVTAGEGGEVLAEDLDLAVTFSGFEVSADLDVRVDALPGSPDAPVVAARSALATVDGSTGNGSAGLPEGAVVVADPFEVVARDGGGREVTSFPHEVIEVPGDGDQVPDSEDIVPGVVLDVPVDAERLEGIDPGQVRLYTRESDEEDWTVVPSFLDVETGRLYGELDHLSAFVVIGVPKVPSPQPRVVLDPDNDVANTISPSGRVTELPFSISLATQVADMLGERCHAQVLVTRSDPAVTHMSQAVRSGMAAAWGPDLTMTLAFDAALGHPWGTESSGGTKVFPGDGPYSLAVADSLNRQLPGYTGRPSRLIGSATLPYDDLRGLPNALVHLETLYLDHNYDWSVIENGFGHIVNGVFTGSGMYLESQGFNCTDPQWGGWPARPSADELARWRHLGYQNYQAYGADPVSYSTGNLIEDEPVLTLPGPGGSETDITLVYNSQDGRASRVGAGWTFDLGARAQRFEDGGVMVVRGDGASFVYEPDGSGGYTTDAGNTSTLRELADGRMEQTDADGTRRVFDTSDLEGIGELVSVTDQQGRTTTLEYGPATDESQFLPLTGIVDSAGQRIVVGQDAAGRVTSFTLPDGRTWGLGYDAAGDLTAIANPDGRTRTFGYDDAHRMTTATDAAGVTYLRNTFDGLGRVVEQFDADGNRRTWVFTDTPDGAGLRQVVYTDNEGRPATYRFDARFRVVEVVDTAGQVEKFTYDGADQVTRFTDAEGRVTAYAYDTAGNLTEQTAPDGTITRWTYDTHGEVTSVAEPDGSGGSRTTTWGLSAASLPEAVTFPDGTSASSSYDTAGNRLTDVDPAGGTTRYAYDSRGNVVTVADPVGAVTSYTYDAANRVTSMTDAGGGVTRYGWDAGDRLVEQVDPVGGVTRYGYDANDLPISVTDPTGATTTLTWDDLFRVTSVTDATGATTRYRYTTEDELVATIDPLGGEVRYELDGADRVVAVTDPVGGRWEMTYDQVGNLLTETTPSGKVTEYTYDRMDRLLSVTDALGATTGYAYDDAGRLVGQVDPLGATTRYEYDSVDQQTAEVNTLGERTEYGYDQVGNLVQVLDRAGRTWSSTYDAAGRVTTDTDPTGAVTSYAYDGVGNLTQVVDALGAVTAYGYDPAGRQVTETDANGHTTTTGYDAAARPTTVTDPLGAVTTTGYDLVGRVTSLTDALGAVTGYEYDGAGRQTATVNPVGARTEYGYDAAGQLTQVVEDATGDPATSTYTYDADGNQVTATDPLGATTGYTYDQVGQMLSTTSPSGAVTEYTYDEAGRPTSVTSPLGGTWAVGYDELGRQVAQVDPYGATIAYAYDGADQVVEVTDQAGQVTAYGYDPGGNLTAMVDRRGHTWGYEYDPVGNLVAEVDPAGARTEHAYDPVGNLASTTDALGATTAFGYDAANRPTTQTDPLGAIQTTSYDPAGQVTEVTDQTGETTRYAYDPAGRLASDTDPLGNVIAYEHDHAGRTTAMVDEIGTRTEYTYDGVGQLVQVVEAASAAVMPDPDTDTDPDTGASPTTASTTGTTDPAEPGPTLVPVEAVTTSYEYDLDGNLITLTDGRGNATTREYDAIGQLLAEHGPVGASYTYSYDEGGRLVRQVDGTGQHTTYTWDERGDLSEIAYVGGGTATFAYDEEQNPISMLDDLGATAWAYDEVGHLVEQVDTEGRSLGYEYDPLGQVIALTLPGGERVGSTFDAAGRMVGQATPWGSLTYTWDPAGRLVTTERTEDDGAAGVTTTVAYDADDRPTAIAHITPSTETAARPVADAAEARVGTEVGVSEEVAAETRSASLPWRLTAVGDGPATDDENSDSGAGCTTAQNYLTGRTVPEGGAGATCLKASEYLAGRTVPDPDPVAADGEGLRYDYTYDPADNVTSKSRTTGWVQPAGTVPDQGADSEAVDPGTGVVDPEGSDPVDPGDGAPSDGDAHADSQVAGPSATVSTQYGYDVLSRLVSSSSSEGVTNEYRYDPVGNRTSWTVDGPDQEVDWQGSYDAGNRLTDVSVIDGDRRAQVRYAVDGNGARLSADVAGDRLLVDALSMQASYDEAGRVISYSAQGATSTTQYDGLGRAVTRSTTEATGTETVSWTYDGLEPVTGTNQSGAHVSLVRDDLGSEVLQIDERLTGTTDGTNRWALVDALGSVVAQASDAVGTSAITQLVEYSDYGSPDLLTGGLASVIGYSGEATDWATGTVDYYQRVYDPTGGAWTAPDAWDGLIEQPKTLNGFAFVQDNPVTNFDLLGYAGKNIKNVHKKSVTGSKPGTTMKAKAAAQKLKMSAKKKAKPPKSSKTPDASNAKTKKARDKKARTPEADSSDRHIPALWKNHEDGMFEWVDRNLLNPTGRANIAGSVADVYGVVGAVATTCAAITLAAVVTVEVAAVCGVVAQAADVGATAWSVAEMVFSLEAGDQQRASEVGAGVVISLFVSGVGRVRRQELDAIGLGGAYDVVTSWVDVGISAVR